MNTKKMFDNEKLDNLLNRMHEALDESGQFDRLAKESDYIRVCAEDTKEYVRVSLLQTYSSKGVFARADGLRIRFESSRYDHQLKTYMVPTWNQSEETWIFSRSKLLVKAADAIATVSEQQAKTDKEEQQRKVFARFIGNELGYLQEHGEVKLVHDFDKRGRSRRKIVRIELPHVHIDLYSPDKGQTFRIESIKPMEGKYKDRYFDIETIKELITKLEEIFEPEEALVLR